MLWASGRERGVGVSSRDLTRHEEKRATYRTRSAHPHVVGDLRDLIRGSVRDVRPGGRAGIGAQDHASVVLARHDGGLSGGAREGETRVSVRSGALLKESGEIARVAA